MKTQNELATLVICHQDFFLLKTLQGYTYDEEKNWYGWEVLSMNGLVWLVIFSQKLR